MDAVAHVPAQGQQAEVVAVQGVEAIVPTGWDDGLDMCRAAINKHSNQIMARSKLMRNMPASNYSDWKKWGVELLEQSRRCTWGLTYTAEVAALDALLYQCPDERWRQKILGGNLTFQEAIDWGVQMLTSKQQSKELNQTVPNKDSPGDQLRDIPLDRVETKTETRKWDCCYCFTNHGRFDSCPARGYFCSDCGEKDHLPKTQICQKGKSPGAARGRGRGRGDTRGRGARGRARGRGGQSKTEFVNVRDAKGNIVRKKVNYVKTYTDCTEEDFEGEVFDYDYPLSRLLTVGKLGDEGDKTYVRITPTNAEYRTNVPWTTDSGVQKTLMAEKHFSWMLEKNPEMKIQRSNVRFKPYSSEVTVPLLGCCEVRLTNNKGRNIKTKVYIAKEETESLLGKEDAIKLGILKINPDGEGPENDEHEKVRCITPEILKEEIESGVVSGGKTQKEIDKQTEDITSKHAGVFEGMGRANTEPIHIKMKDDVTPIAQGKRPIPHQFLKPFIKKMEYMKENGLVEGPLPPNECTGWIHNPVITKKSWSSDEVRINIDTKRMNEQLVHTKIPIPTTEELRHDLEGSDRFSALDCRDSFFHFPLDDETQELFKFHGHDGLYRFKVLVTGTPPASGECHAAMSRILQGLEGVVVIKDDILVHGEGDKHDENLKACLDRLHDNRIRLRREKCKLGKQQVMWFGHIYSKQGMSPDPAKVEHIKAWPAPKSKEEVKAFLQTVQFVAQYMRCDKGTPHADVTAPLRALTRANVRFMWDKKCQWAFEELKRRISQRTVLVHYVPDLDTRLYVDHGPDGIGSTLAQKHTEDGQAKWKTVHHMSRSLVKSEKNYDKVEGESLAIYSGVLMNKRYLFGAPFTVMTDHSSLPTLYNSRRPAPHRVDRHRGRLGAFQFTTQYVPGDKNPADYGSRHPDAIPESMTAEEREEMGIETEEEDTEIWVNRVLEKTLPAITMEQMREATQQDEELAEVVKEKKTGTKSKKMSKGPYGKMWDDLQERNGILLKDGKQMVVPKSLQAQAIAIAHEGHMKADGTLRQLRESQWFRNMRGEVQKFVDSCKCATANPRNPTPPMRLRPMPTEPWKVTAVDYKGPIGGPGGWYLHTQMDLYSRWPEVYMTKSTKMEELKKVLGRTMRLHGRPNEIWSDGGAPYNSREWETWVSSWGTKPRKTTPYHPPANGLVERFNQSLKATIHAAYAAGTDPVEEVDKFVASYRNTPHSTTGEKPSKLMFNRDVETKLPRFTKPGKGKHHQDARENDRQKKQEMKKRFDTKKRTKQVDIKPGDWAYRKNMTPTTIKGPWEPIPFQIIKVEYDRITGIRDGETSTRIRGHWKLVVSRPAHLEPFTWDERPSRCTPAGAAINELDGTDPWDDDDYGGPGGKPNTRARAAERRQQQPPPPLAPFQELPPQQDQVGDQAADNEEAADVPEVATQQDHGVDQAANNEEAMEGCSHCRTKVTMTDNRVTCLHWLRQQGYTQYGGWFFKNVGQEGEIQHKARTISIPKWMFPSNTTHMEAEGVDTRVLLPIMVALQEAKRPMTTDTSQNEDDAEADSEYSSAGSNSSDDPCHGFSTPSPENDLEAPEEGTSPRAIHEDGEDPTHEEATAGPSHQTGEEDEDGQEGQRPEEAFTLSPERWLRSGAHRRPFRLRKKRGGERGPI